MITATVGVATVITLLLRVTMPLGARHQWLLKWISGFLRAGAVILPVAALGGVGWSWAAIVLWVVVVLLMTAVATEIASFMEGSYHGKGNDE